MAKSKQTDGRARPITFSVSDEDARLIQELQLKLSISNQVLLNQSEIVRMGIAALSLLNQKQVKTALQKMRRFKRGRPTGEQ